MAGIIKAGSPIRASGTIRSVEFNFDDISGKADQYLESVRGDAATILDQARIEAEQIKERARFEGQAEARTEAESTMRAVLDTQLQSLMPALQGVVGELQRSKIEWVENWERGAVQLAAAIARRVVRRELQVEPAIGEQWVREALELTGGCGHIELHLNPQDLSTLGESAASLTATIESFAQVETVGDPAVEPGQCLVVTQFGQIDQRLETQLNRIEEELNA